MGTIKGLVIIFYFDFSLLFSYSNAYLCICKIWNSIYILSPIKFSSSSFINIYINNNKMDLTPILLQYLSSEETYSMTKDIKLRVLYGDKYIYNFNLI